MLRIEREPTKLYISIKVFMNISSNEHKNNFYILLDSNYQKNCRGKCRKYTFLYSISKMPIAEVNLACRPKNMFQYPFFWARNNHES